MFESQGGWSGMLFGQAAQPGVDGAAGTAATKGNIGGIASAAGALSNAYLGYKSLEEARKSRLMEEAYAKTNLYNTATAYNTNLSDTASNNAAINGWSDSQKASYVSNNSAQTSI